MSTSVPAKLTNQTSQNMKTKPHAKPSKLGSAETIVRRPPYAPVAVVPVALLRGVCFRVRPVRFIYATCKDFATLSRLVACILYQTGGKAEISRSGNFGYWATIERPEGTEIVVEG